MEPIQPAGGFRQFWREFPLGLKITLAVMLAGVIYGIVSTGSCAFLLPGRTADPGDGPPDRSEWIGPGDLP